MAATPTALARLCLMDWFGCLLMYDPNKKELMRAPFVPGDYPDFFVIMPYPIETLAKPIFRQRASIPQGFPEMTLEKMPDNRIALQNVENGQYLSVNPRSHEAGFWAGAAQAWETFAPLTPEMLDGLALLADRDLASVETENGEQAPELEFGTMWNGFGGGNFGNFEFRLMPYLDEIADLAKLAPGESATLKLKSHSDGKIRSFRVTRKAQPKVTEEKPATPAKP